MPRLQVPYKSAGVGLITPGFRGRSRRTPSLDETQVREVLNDWDEGKGYWRNSAGHWATLLKVSPSTILAARRGDTWKHLKHSNAGRKKEN